MMSGPGEAGQTLSAGAVFADYRIIRLLGAGAVGEVYLAGHPRLPRQDALKVLAAALTADVEFRQRFRREADLAATLFHPNIVGVLDRGEYDRRLWIAMDYVDGTDAARLRGLLHRDVKPANILLADADARFRRILLADFGIVRQLGEVSGLTATNFTLGTLSYAAPEQLMGFELDGRADQYALAATAYHLLTGGPPYAHDNPVAVISAHLNATPPRLGARHPELAGLDAPLAIALAKNPADRFADCREFARALADRFNVGAATAVRPPRL